MSEYLCTLKVEAMQFPEISVANVDALIDFETWLQPLADTNATVAKYVGSGLRLVAPGWEAIVRPGEWVVFYGLVADGSFEVISNDEFINKCTLAD